MAQRRITKNPYFVGIFLLSFAFLHQNVQGFMFGIQIPTFIKSAIMSAKDKETEDESKVTFHLYSNNKDVTETTELLLNVPDRLFKSPFIPNAPLAILIHGFMSSYQTNHFQDIKNAYLTKKNGSTLQNVVIVDWKELAAVGLPVFIVNTYYTAATKNVPTVGKKVAKLISFLVENKYTTLDLVHIVGHSLGAHVSGVAGNSTKEKYGKPVGRITGLDPAGPLFYSHALGRPLTLDDAKLVDIIHTGKFFLGKAGQIGHADFYPNGGSLVQTECLGDNVLGTGLVKEILTLGVCSHSESNVLFKKSIGTTKLRGCKCSSYLAFKASQCVCKNGDENQAIMGENIQNGTVGSFYLEVELWMEGE